MKKIKLSVASILLSGICYAQSPVVQQDDYLFIKNKDMQYLSMNVESMIEWIRADIKTNEVKPEVAQSYVESLTDLLSKLEDLNAGLEIKNYR
tara:strand:+ start:197 stop:475 length:279 start_codon:yes stop_codon:yes gene_type:complete